MVDPSDTGPGLTSRAVHDRLQGHATPVQRERLLATMYVRQMRANGGNIPPINDKLQSDSAVYTTSAAMILHDAQSLACTVPNSLQDVGWLVHINQQHAVNIL